MNKIENPNDPDLIDMVDLMEYIKVQWADIHHSRNQEWKILSILGAVSAGFIASFFVCGLDISARRGIIIFGQIVCIIGICISVQHWRIFRRKMQVISYCEDKLKIEEKLGNELPFKEKHFPVQGMIVLLYFVILGGLTSCLSGLFGLGLVVSGALFVAVFLFGLLVVFLLFYKMAKKDKKLREENGANNERDSTKVTADGGIE